LVAGFGINRIDFKHTNNSPFSGTSSVSPVNFDPGLFVSPIPTVPSFSSVTNQYALFAEDRLSVTVQLSLVAGVRQDQPTIARTDLIAPANGFDKSFSATSWRGGAVYTPVKEFAFYGQYSVAVDPVGNLITLTLPNKNFQLSTGKQAEGSRMPRRRWRCGSTICLTRFMRLAVRPRSGCSACRAPRNCRSM